MWTFLFLVFHNIMYTAFVSSMCVGLKLQKRKREKETFAYYYAVRCFSNVYNMQN